MLVSPSSKKAEETIYMNPGDKWAWTRQRLSFTSICHKIWDLSMTHCMYLFYFMLYLSAIVFKAHNLQSGSATHHLKMKCIEIELTDVRWGQVRDSAWALGISFAASGDKLAKKYEGSVNQNAMNPKHLSGLALHYTKLLQSSMKFVPCTVKGGFTRGRLTMKRNQGWLAVPHGVSACH